MKKVYLLAVIAAVLFGALMYLYLQGSNASATAPVETKTVVVATVDIGPDVTITEGMVTEQQVAADSVQVNALSSKEDVVGKSCPAQITKGEQLLKNMLSDADETGKRLAAQLESGMRAMTIKVETEAGGGGYVQAGDCIDLIGESYYVDEEGTVHGTANPYTIVEAVDVLRVNEATDEGETPYSYLTLALTEAQCKAVYDYQVWFPSGSTADYHVLLRSSKRGV